MILSAHSDGIVRHLDVGSHILGLKKAPRVQCSLIKVVRELGPERRETVRSHLSKG
jgi:hypothetical protein